MGHNSAFGILMGAAVGTCSLVLACGPPQDAQSAPCPDVDPASSVLDLLVQSPLEDLTRCGQQGHAEAQFLVGLRYEVGSDVPPDDAEAVRWYRLAAEQGHASGQNNLGGMYGNGEGVPEDDVFAYMWWNLSAAQGNEAAQSNKDIIEQRMTREQIAEAQRLSREWLAAHPPGGN